VQGEVIGLRRIRTLKAPVQGKTLVMETENDSFVRVVGWLSHEDTFAPEENVYETYQDPAYEDVTDKIISSDAKSLVADFGDIREIKGFVITPDPEDREGLPLRYSIYVSNDAKEWDCLLLDYGFENMQANPMPQRVNISPVKCRYFRFESFQSVVEGAPMKIQTFAVLNQK